MDYYGSAYLNRKLNSRRNRVLERYDYYDMKKQVIDLKISTPPKLMYLNSALGWCGKAVDSLADRIVFREFKNDDFNVNEIFRMNSPKILTDSAILGALISSCDFMYISKGTNGEVRLQVIDGGNATGILDPITYLLKEGYAVLERGERKEVKTYAYFTSEYTEVTSAGKTVRYPNPTGIPLLVPIINKPDATRVFGHSRISRACMKIQDSALRTLKRSEIAAEFYSYPQKYVTGLDPDRDPLDSWKATMSAMLTFDRDNKGNSPTVGQFTAHSMEPHTKQIEMLARLFAGEVGLTADDLGITTSNPTSADAIKASHENLRLSARKAQRDFEVGFVNTAYVACCLRDERKYDRYEFANLKVAYEPIFEPDISQLGAIGDALLKLSQASGKDISEEVLRDLTGFEL